MVICSDSPSPRSASVLVCSRYPAVMDGLKNLVVSQPDLQLAGCAATVESALEQIRLLQPGMVVLDNLLENGGEIGSLRMIRAQHPELPVLVYSANGMERHIRRCLQAGAMGFVEKDQSLGRVADGIRQILQGRMFFNLGMVSELSRDRVVNDAITLRGDPARLLTGRQMEIFDMIGKGLQSAEIGSRLGLSKKTIDVHRSNIRQRLGVDASRDLLSIALEWGQSQAGSALRLRLG